MLLNTLTQNIPKSRIPLFHTETIITKSPNSSQTLSHAKKSHGSHIQANVSTYFTGLYPLCQDLFNSINILAQHAKYLPIQFLIAQADNFSYDEKRDASSLLYGGQMVSHHLLQMSQDIIPGFKVLDITDQALFNIINQKRQNLLLAFEMFVDSALRDSDLFGNPSDTNVFTAILKD